MVWYGLAYISQDEGELELRRVPVLVALWLSFILSSFDVACISYAEVRVVLE